MTQCNETSRGTRAAMAAVVFLAAFFSVALTLKDFGLGWDEGIDTASARMAESWFLLPVSNPDGERMFSEKTLERYWGTDAKHPAVTRTWYALTHIATARLSGGLMWREVYSWRVGSALLFAGLVAGVFLAGAAMYGAAGGLVAVAALAGMPHVFGIAHLQCTDLMLTVLNFAAAWAFVGGMESRRKALLFGILAGLLPAVKLTGAVAAIPFIAWGLAAKPRKMGWNLLALAVAAPAAFVLLQPGLWHHPVAHTLQYWREHVGMTTVKYIHVPYFGGIYDARPPWHYAPVMVALTVPAITLIAALIGAFRGEKDAANPTRLRWFLLINSAFYAAVFCVTRIPVYDGARLFLMVFPFIALLAGAGFALAAGRSPGAARWVAAVALCAAMLFPVWRAHPFELSYYNAFIGGLSGAAKRGMEITYWGEALSPAVLEQMNNALPKNATLSAAGTNPYNFDTYYQWGLIRKDIRVVPYGTEFEYVLLVSRTGSFDPFCRLLYRDGRPVWRISHDGVPIVSMYHVIKR